MTGIDSLTWVLLNRSICSAGQSIKSWELVRTGPTCEDCRVAFGPLFMLEMNFKDHPSICRTTGDKVNLYASFIAAVGTLGKWVGKRYCRFSKQIMLVIFTSQS